MAWMARNRRRRAPRRAQRPQTRRVLTLLGDIANGALRGAFAPRLGVAGTITQAALGYVPYVGTAAALRDLAASAARREYLDTALNALALLPFAGGVPRTIEAAHLALRVRRALAGRAARRKRRRRR